MSTHLHKNKTVKEVAGLTCVARETGTVVSIDKVITCCSVLTGIAGALVNVVLTVVVGVSGDTGAGVCVLAWQVNTCGTVDTPLLCTHVLVYALCPASCNHGKLSYILM